MELSKNIERLIKYGLYNKMIDRLDMVLVRNELMTLLKVAEPYNGEVKSEDYNSPVNILRDMLDIAIEKGYIEDNITERDILDAKIMAKLMPRQSELNRMFEDIKAEEGLEKATDFYYKLSKDSNYIRMDRINKNKYWVAPSEYGDLEITINLSKPEKDPKEIEKAKSMPQSNYPKCFLCLENVGYEGRFNHPARSNHRVLPITLNDEQFYLQYSPYVYYNEHSIIFKESHEPMSITKMTFKRLLEFVEKMPHYFIGSNADLPIVGGSILSHEHYQGGHHSFPMEKSPVIKSFKSEEFKTVNIGIIKWPLSVVRLSSKDCEEVVELAGKILASWREYTDEKVGVLAYSNYKGERTPHNTITPIARINSNGEYELDLALRNNRRNEKYPDGIFHPHPEYHHIKKENIGLIEVMGLAVLPARLKEELNLVNEYISSHDTVSELPGLLEKHNKWIDDLLGRKNEMPNDDRLNYIEQQVGTIFMKVLECCGVFKQDESGLDAFESFIKQII